MSVRARPFQVEFECLGLDDTTGAVWRQFVIFMFEEVVAILLMWTLL